VAAATGVPLALRREFGQPSDHFSPPAPNSFPIEAGDTRQFGIAWTSRLLREHPDIPPPLRLGQPAEKEVYALMLLDDIRISPSLAVGALAPMNTYLNWFGHPEPPTWMVPVYQHGEVVLL
jgi:hypothetical protein